MLHVQAGLAINMIFEVLVCHVSALSSGQRVYSAPPVILNLVIHMYYMYTYTKVVSSLRNFYQILPFSYLLLDSSNMDCITLGTMPIQIKEIYQYMHK
jgi:hypothetical protein